MGGGGFQMPKSNPAVDTTTQQNIAQGIGTLAQTYLNVQGAQNTANITVATLVKSGRGRIANVAVIVAGAVGRIYDANSASATTNPIFVIPAALGVYVVNFPLNFGLVVAPGAGQTVSVSWS